MPCSDGSRQVSSDPVHRIRFWRYRKGHECPLIFIVGLPRSGTTWLTQMFTSVQGYRYLSPWHATQTDHDLREKTLQGFAHQWVVLRLHLPWSEENARILEASRQHYVVTYRDLRDVVVSWYHYVSKVDPQHFLRSQLRSLSLEEGIDYYIEHILEYEVRWIRDWRSHRHPELSTETRYETPRGGTLSEFGRLAGFFGLDLTDAEIARIVDENSFQKRTQRRPGTEDRGCPCAQGSCRRLAQCVSPQACGRLQAFSRGTPDRAGLREGRAVGAVKSYGPLVLYSKRSRSSKKRRSIYSSREHRLSARHQMR